MRFSLLILACIVFSCKNKPNSTTSSANNPRQLEEGMWRFSFQLGKEELPFNVKFEDIDQNNGEATIYNGEERIKIKEFHIKNDSIFMSLPVFSSELVGRIESNELITGKWLNKSKKDYTIPFVAEANKSYRFTPTDISTKIPHRYHAIFDPNSDEPWNAILILSEDSNRYTGTFLTETGDYRYLQGNVMNKKLYLSTFDGSHAFLFTADISGDSLLNGTFTSGIHYSTNWVAKADETFMLRNPEKLTYLKPGYDKIDFKLPNENGDTVTWADLNLDGKVVILDIMGSWCPNCMDANRALHQLVSKFSDNEIVVIPIAYETTSDFAVSKKKITKMQQDLGMKPHFLFGGKADIQHTSKDFPMLNGIMSYPTLIIIGSDRKVADIYTGFYGPGTGEYYKQFMDHTDSLLTHLVSQIN